MRYVARPASGNEENRWLRLEQLLPEDESLSVAEAAKAIDALFNIEPCDQGLGGGGEAVIRDADGLPANQPPEERLEEVVRDVLGPDLCNQTQHWVATVLVLRSHQQPGYTLRSEGAEVLSTELIEKEVTETLEMNGATSKDLSWPYVGGLSAGLSSDITAKVLGSTINLSGPVERLNLRYRTRYEQLRIRVPLEEKLKRREDETLQRPELPAAAVIAFWGDLAAACELKPPPTDERSSQDELDRLCRGPVSSWENITPKECWQTLEHYQMCNCSKKRTNVWREVVPVTCPDGADASSYFVSNRSVFDGYVTCPDEEDEVNDPEYYEEKCCIKPPKSLPRCRKTYAVWNGGAEIEGGPQRWLDIYGPGTRLIPVAPKDGICGELVIEWAVNVKNCCDDLAPPEIEGENIVVAPGSQVLIRATNYTSRGKWYSDKLNVLEQSADSAIFRAPGDFCGMALVQITDACGRIATRKIRSTAGKWIPHPLADICDPALYGGAMPQGEAINIGIRDDIKVEFAAELCGPEGTGYADYVCPRKPTCFSPGGGGYHEFVCWQNIGRRDQGVIGYMDHLVNVTIQNWSAYGRVAWEAEPGCIVSKWYAEAQGWPNPQAAGWRTQTRAITIKAVMAWQWVCA